MSGRAASADAGAAASRAELREEKRAADSERALKIWDQCVSIGSNATVATYFGARRLDLPPTPTG